MRLPFIVASEDGWEPTNEEVSVCLIAMGSKGFRTDWKYCLGLESHALMFAEHSDYEKCDSCLVFYKGQFLTEREYLEAK